MYRANAASHRDLFVCYCRLSLSWATFLNHFSTGTVLFLVELSIAFTWHFQDAGISKAAFPADTRSSSCWAVSEPRTEEPGSQAAKPCSVTLWAALWFRSHQDYSHRKAFHHVRPWRQRGVSNVVRKVLVLLEPEQMAVLCSAGGSKKLRCDLARAKAMAEVSWSPWRPPVITPHGFQCEAACPALHEALRREQCTSDRHFCLFGGSGQSLWGWRQHFLSQHAQLMHRHLPGCWPSSKALLNLSKV